MFSILKLFRVYQWNTLYIAQKTRIFGKEFNVFLFCVFFQLTVSSGEHFFWSPFLSISTPFLSNQQNLNYFQDIFDNFNSFQTKCPSSRHCWGCPRERELKRGCPPNKQKDRTLTSDRSNNLIFPRVFNITIVEDYKYSLTL